jgi:ribosomal protein L15
VCRDKTRQRAADTGPGISKGRVSGCGQDGGRATEGQASHKHLQQDRRKVMDEVQGSQVQGLL